MNGSEPVEVELPSRQEFVYLIHLIPRDLRSEPYGVTAGGPTERIVDVVGISRKVPERSVRRSEVAADSDVVPSTNSASRIGNVGPELAPRELRQRHDVGLYTIEHKRE